jgi:hypothetical protein
VRPSAVSQNAFRELISFSHTAELSVIEGVPGREQACGSHLIFLFFFRIAAALLREPSTGPQVTGNGGGFNGSMQH